MVGWDFVTHVPRRRLIYGAARRSGGGCASVPLIARPDSAAGVTLTVNSTADGVDASPGNGVCATAGGQCTLRAAIQEANSLAGATRSPSASAAALSPSHRRPVCPRSPVRSRSTEPRNRARRPV